MGPQSMIGFYEFKCVLVCEFKFYKTDASEDVERQYQLYEYKCSQIDTTDVVEVAQC